MRPKNGASLQTVRDAAIRLDRWPSTNTYAMPRALRAFRRFFEARVGRRMAVNI